MEEFKNMDKLKDDLFEAIDTICKDYESKQEPEFKVGQWVVTASCNEVKRIKEINGDIIKYDDGCTHTSWKGFIRLATPAEIESHLRKICDEKGFKDGVKYHYPDRPDLSPRIFKSPLHLSLNNDYLYDTHSNIIWEADRGFAEIIPDKKKLPETEDEFKEFLNEYDIMKDVFPSRGADFFLGQYDI